MEHSKQQLVAHWVLTYSKEMLQWAGNRVPQKEVAEDLVQDTFLAAFQKAEEFQERSQVKTWLFGILKNKIADHFRQAYRIPTYELISDPFFDDTETWKDNQTPKTWVAQSETELLDDAGFRSVLEECLQRLPPKWHHSIHLKYIEQKEGPEVCQEVGISTTNYWQMLHRAKLQLRKCLEINWFKL